jgi:acetyl esterase/lipase
MPSEQAMALWQAFRDGPKMIDMPLAERRAAGEHAEDETSEPAGVRYDQGEAGIWATPPDATSRAAVLYLFGGGYVLGSPASRRKTAGHLALASGCTVLAAPYRLAPEHPFPAALDDALRIARAQTSAGGNATVDLVGGCQHVFPIWSGLLPEADAAIHRIGAWISATTRGSAVS